MKKSFSKLFLAPLTVLVLASFAMTPVADARDGGGRGGGGGGGGGARASAGGGGGGGGGARASGGGGGRQVNNTNTDARANNVRNTSVNNVNSNRNTNVNASRNTNVNVNASGGCCGGGWDNDYHPVATAAVVVGTAAIIGSMVRTVPANCVPVNYGGMVYQQCGSTWYQPQGGQYVVINPPY
jgi:hypothetical protein